MGFLNELALTVVASFLIWGFLVIRNKPSKTSGDTKSVGKDQNPGGKRKRN